VLLRIWLKQGKEKKLLARILEILEKARKRPSRQNSTKKCVNVREKGLNNHVVATKQRKSQQSSVNRYKTA